MSSAEYFATGSGPVLLSLMCASWMTSKPPGASAAKDFSRICRTTGVSQSCSTFEIRCTSQSIGHASVNMFAATTDTRSEQPRSAMARFATASTGGFSITTALR